MRDAIWPLIPAVLMAAATIIRTSLQGRMLRVEMEGYQECAEETRYRPLAGVWSRGIPVACAEPDPRAYA